MLFNRAVNQLDSRLRRSFEKIKLTFEDHLTAINQNTTEIQNLYEYIQALEAQIAFLRQKVEEIQLKETHFKTNISLTREEREIFLTLYTDEEPLSVFEISKRTGLSEEEVHLYLNNLLIKGIPVIKRFFGNQTFVKLDSRFKEIQAKEKIINLSLESFIPVSSEEG